MTIPVYGPATITTSSLGGIPGFTFSPTLPLPGGFMPTGGIPDGGVTGTICGIARTFGYTGGCSIVELVAAGFDIASGKPKNLVGPGGCTPPLVMDQSGICVAPGSPGDMSTNGQAQPPGQVVQGKWGPAEMPKVSSRTVRKCRKGFVLGDDNLCYSKKEMPRNARNRKWRPGMRPIVTAGQRRATKIAARAADELEGHVKELQKLGLMKKPKPRAQARHVRTQPTNITHG